MSVWIKGMKMPKSCYNCKLDLRTDVCQAFCEWKAEHPYSIKTTDRLPNCPLVELPKKHGRLFDTDEVVKCLEELPDCNEKAWAIGLLEWAIAKRWCIEAEGEG